ncbi:etoposide-induced protein 2.4 homolog [Actinia tenebrosa]|uniref:Etoposide-induced protein 2.4 homolog n=1 Tax=Actinia tenebrosa TaxID=6105 RepID=A0A6P8II94_ACTTE|nr:etoposide-induced protein 2.4 homolog [Actinia tenebrosa]
MSEFKPFFLGFGNGLKDSLLGITAIFRLDSETEKKEEEKQRKLVENQRQLRGMRTRPKTDNTQPAKQILKNMVQCCLLNGGIFWLSIFLFESYIIPALQWLTHLVFELVSGSSTHHSSVWYWMGPALSYVFGALWVLPLFWLSKPLNSLWFQEIADSAYRKNRGRPLGLVHISRGESVSSYVSRSIADFAFSVLLQAFFLIQGMLVGFLPVLGPLASLIHMCLLYSLYAFEYKWVNMDWSAPKRLAYIESNWPYFVGFGLPLALMTALPSSVFVSGCVFAILFPLFIISGNEANVSETNQFPIRVFRLVVWLTNKVFHKSTSKPRPQQPDVQNQSPSSPPS